MKENKKKTKQLEEEKRLSGVGEEECKQCQNPQLKGVHTCAALRPKFRKTKKAEHFKVKLRISTGELMTKKKLAKEVLNGLPSHWSGVYIEVTKDKKNKQ